MTQGYRNTLKHSDEMTLAWIHEIDEALGWDDRNRSFRLLRVTLHALRDLLPLDEAAQFSAQLPLLIRGLFFENWNPSGASNVDRRKAGFVARISEAFTTDPLDNPEEAIGAVFGVLNSRISKGEIDDVRHALRRRLRDIWPTAES